MQNNLLFSLLDKANHDKRLFEKITLQWFNSKGEIIKKTTSQYQEVDIVSVFISLSNDKKIFLYTKAPIYEYFLSYSILVGEDTPLYKANLLDEGVVYFEKHYLDEIKETLIHSTIESTTAEEVYGYELFWEFKKPKILSEIGEFVYEKKGLKLNTIHVHKGDSIELFTPTLKRNHFEIAKTMQLPLYQLISRGYLVQTHINIFDRITLFKELSCYKQEKQHLLRRVSLKGERLYRDIEKQLLLDLPVETLQSYFESIENRNLSKTELLNQLSQHKTLTIGSTYANLHQMPIWKSHGEFITFSNENTFEEYTGLLYQRKQNELHMLYLMNSQGEELSFPNYYLNDSLHSLFQIQRPPLLNFNTYEELFVLSYLYEDDFPYSILVKSFPIDSKKIVQIYNISSNMLRSLLSFSLSNNTLPKAIRSQTPLERVIQHHIHEISQLRNSYLEEAKEKLLESTISSANCIKNYFNSFDLTINASYFYLEFVKELLTTLNFFNEKAYDLEEIFDAYFKDVKSRYHLPLEDEEYRICSSLLLAQLISKNHTIYVHKFAFSSYRFEGITSFLSRENSYEIIQKLNKKKLKQTFPKGYQQIIEYYYKYKTLPQTIKRGTYSIPIDSSAYVREIPIFNYCKIKSVTRDFIVYAQ